MKKNLNLKIEEAIKKCGLEEKINIDDVKNIIWNEKGERFETLPRLVNYFIEESKLKNIKEINKITGVLSEAWNNFPHASLGGISPSQMINKNKKPKSLDKKIGRSIQEIFNNQLPQVTKFVKIGENKWGFEFPKSYFDICDMYDILHETELTENEYKNGLEKILSIMPEFFDAASDLANYYLEKKDIKQAKIIFQKHINYGKSFISSEFKLGINQMIWAYLDNRPFLRLLHNYAMFIEKFGSISKAIPLFEEIILLNPNDNQGIRDFLATDYLKVSKLGEMFELAGKYPDDITPQVVMGEILALIKMEKLKEAEKKLRKNYEFQKHVIKELLKKKHPIPKNLIPDRVTVGGEDEAYYYFLEQGALWTMTKGAIEFLKDFVENHT